MDDYTFPEFTFQAFYDVFSTFFEPVRDFFTGFFLDWFTSLKGISDTGDAILSCFFNLFSSADISNFLSIFVGFVFTFFIVKLSIKIIRG